MKGGELPNNCNERNRGQCERDTKCMLLNDRCIRLEKPINRTQNFDLDYDSGDDSNDDA